MPKLIANILSRVLTQNQTCPAGSLYETTLATSTVRSSKRRAVRCEKQVQTWWVAGGAEAFRISSLSPFLIHLLLSQPELVMHSLRHGAHYLHALGCPQDVAEMLTGHTATSVHDKVYAHRELTPLTRLRDGLKKMQFPAVLKALASN